MTHGCLIIRAVGERRRLLLHTYHTGMNIPLAVERALPERARDKFGFLAEWWFRRRFSGRKGMAGARATLRDHLYSGAITDGAGFPPSAAAWIIAASPGLLEPTPWSFVKDLADWSGIDHPYTLTISDDTWTLKGQDGALLATIDVAATMFEAVWQMVRRSRKAPRPGDLDDVKQAAVDEAAEVDDDEEWTVRP